MRMEILERKMEKTEAKTNPSLSNPLVPTLFFDRDWVIFLLFFFDLCAGDTKGGIGPTDGDNNRVTFLVVRIPPHENTLN